VNRLAALAGLTAALALPAPAAAEDVTAAELAVLVERAPGDPAARERLLAVDRVDGRPVAVRAALGGAQGDELGPRAALLVAALRAGGERAEAAPARERARRVLADRRYHGTELPRPFAGPIEWLSERIEPLIEDVNDFGVRVPGGPAVLWLALAGLVLLAATGVTSTSIRRRAVAIERARAAALPATDDPRALEREAERAERASEWERAVRLRFRAGLLRLDGRGVIAYRPSLTTGEVSRAVGSPAFAEVGARFDAIAYGGRPAAADDADAARRGWAAVLAEAGRR
jgi:hypothetical protein